MQYQTLLNVATIHGSGNGTRNAVTIPLEVFRSLLIAALRAKGEFDEAFYLASNSDIRIAIQKREIHSASDHYYNTGYFEGRMPKKFIVDESYYLRENKDVAAAVKLRKIKNCQIHFDTNGFKEGRAPFAGFSLF